MFCAKMEGNDHHAGLWIISTVGFEFPALAFGPKPAVVKSTKLDAERLHRVTFRRSQYNFFKCGSLLIIDIIAGAEGLLWSHFGRLAARVLSTSGENCRLFKY